MELLTDRKYTFVSSALPPDTFAVVDMKGEEGLGRCYRFEILLVSDNAEIDMERVLRSRATFTIHRPEADDVVFHGVTESFDQLQAVGSGAFYRVTVVPRLQRLNLTRHNQVFLNQTLQEIIAAVLKEGGLTSQDFEFKLQGEYTQLSYVCQYGETHLNFISRWLEREGIYYYFEQTDSGEKVIFTDTAIAHQPRSHGQDLVYAPPSGLIDAQHAESVLGWVCRTKTVPRMVRLKDYNYRKPSLEVTAEAVADEKSSGEVYLYGEHFRSPQDGDRLARIRAQELICGREMFNGESTVPYISPGYTFTLGNHYRRSFNQKYLTVEMTHEGSQAGFLTAGLQQALSAREKKIFYRNQFTAIPAGVQFRPAQTAHKPRIRGTLNAKIDAAGSGKYAELDAHGRYKVILPFDRSGRKEGKASAWLRMAQPYAGQDHGMHFPLHKGTEVLLTFIEGHPDRPVIAAAVPNTETPSPVTAADQTMAKITTAGGNKIHIEDQEGSERILLHSPNQESFIRIGAHNDPDEAEGTWGEWHGISEKTKGAIEVKCQTKNEFILGEETVTVLGGHMKNILGIAADISAGGTQDIKLLYHNEFKPIRKCFNPEKTEVNLDSTKLIDQETNIVQETVRLSASTMEVVARHEELVDDETRIVEVITEVADGHTQIKNNLESLIGEGNQIAGRITTIAGNLSEMASEKSELYGSLSRNAVDITELAVQKDQLVEGLTELVGEMNVISGLINFM